MRLAIHAIGRILTGDLAEPVTAGDVITINDGLIESVGGSPSGAYDVEIDARGATVAPGLIDSHVHVAFGDFTPRQNAVGYLASYVHGGVTTSISASEVHVPGRPDSRSGLVALAVAAHQSYERFRPGGMRVHGGSLILDPVLQDEDFAAARAGGVWLVKAGFGAVTTPADYVPLVADADYERVIAESEITLQLCTAGNLRTLLHVASQAVHRGELGRIILGTDTPTGSGIMPLGLWYTISQLASLAKIDPAVAVAWASGNTADVYGLETGRVQPGLAADVVLLDAPLGAAHADPLDALANGDVPGIGAVITDGMPRFVGRSRNSPPPSRQPVVTLNELRHDFSTSH